MGRAICLCGAMCRTQDVVVLDKNAKECMRSGDVPHKKEPNYEQDTAELNPTIGPGFVGGLSALCVQREQKADT